MRELAAVLVLLLTLGLVLGTAPLEIATGLVAALALLRMLRGESKPDADFWPPLLLLLLLSLATVPTSAAPLGTALRAALEPVWAWSPLLLLPALSLRPPQVERATRVGLGAAGLLGAAALVRSFYLGQLPWELPARGLFSHHLTLGYALLPPLAVALQRRRWLPALGMVAGVVAAGSSGPALALAVILGGLLVGPLAALLGGALAAVGLVASLATDPQVHERALLWTSGALLALSRPMGTSAAGFREAVAPVQDALSPGFYFPLHAHDTALQAAAVAGLGAWVVWGWLLWTLWRRGGTAGRLAIAALLVGGTTQDTLGDLEVVRALCVWAVLAGPPQGTADGA